jgi:hypothetical protein
MVEQIMGILLDIGLGALAYNLARSLKASVTSNSAALAGVVRIQEDHEQRIRALEEETNGK